jgi:stage V sporulation protein D (sporulation-specific penicillin-binding protein)
LVALVVIDEPVGGVIYGGQIAGPVFQKVIADSLNYLGIKPDLPEEEKAGVVKVPDMRNLYIEDAKTILSKNGLLSRVEGEGYVVTSQVPAPGAEVEKNSTVILKVSDSRTNKDPVTIPDLKGRTVKEATDIVNAIGLNIEIVGSGYAVKQNPQPNSEVGIGTTIRVEFASKQME